MSQAELIKNMFSYHPPKGNQTSRYITIRDEARIMAKIIVECCPVSEEYKIALQKLREVVMWANASIACNE